MRRRPLVAIACSWITGTSIATVCLESYAIAAIAALLLLLAGLALSGTIGLKLAIACGLALILACAQKVWTEQRNVSDLAEADGRIEAEAIIEGTIASTVEVDGDLVSFQLKSSRIQLPAADWQQKMTDTVVTRIKLEQEAEQLEAMNWGRGDTLRIQGILQLPGETGNIGAFDYRAYLKKQGIHWQLSVKGLKSIERTLKPMPFMTRSLRILDNLRGGISKLMDRLYSQEDSGYMKGLVVGIRADLDPIQFDSFARIGLTHVLAISGLHVGVVVYLLLRISSWVRLTRERALDVTIAMLPLYMMITGASPSVVRACLMAMLALWLARRHALKDGLHLLLAAAMLMLIWKPSLIEDISFQLSFIVTAGLILFVPTVNALLPIPWPWLKGPIAVSVTAQVVSFPVTVYYFHSVHLLSLPANLLLVPFISMIVMPLGMASVVLGAINVPVGAIPAKLATIGNQITFLTVDKFNSFIELRTVWPQPSLLWVVAAYILMGFGMIGLRERMIAVKHKEWWREQSKASELKDAEADITNHSSGGNRKPAIMLIGLALLGGGWLVWGIQPSWLDHRATVAFINVGQGDSVLIRTGQGKHILIDTGGTVTFRKSGEEWRERSDPYEVGRKLLVPLLLQRGVRELDALVLTHMDTDHIGGAEAVIGNLPVRKLLFNGTVKNSPGAIKLLSLAAEQQIACYAVHSSLEWKIDASTNIQVLYPIRGDSDSDQSIAIEPNQNNQSVVLLVQFLSIRSIQYTLA